MITAKVRKSFTKWHNAVGYVGYIVVQDGPTRWSENAGIVRTTKQDALKDAQALQQWHTHRNHSA